jgi:hypothetical protein
MSRDAICRVMITALGLGMVKGKRKPLNDAGISVGPGALGR